MAGKIEAAGSRVVSQFAVGEVIGVEAKSSSTFLAAKRWNHPFAYGSGAATAKSHPNSQRHAHRLPELGATAQAVDAHRTLHLSGCACGKLVRV